MISRLIFSICRARVQSCRACFAEAAWLSLLFYNFRSIYRLLMGKALKFQLAYQIIIGKT